MAQQNVAYHVGFMHYMVRSEINEHLPNQEASKTYVAEDLYNSFRSFVYENGYRLEGYSLRKLRNRLTALAINHSIEVLDAGRQFKFTYRTFDEQGTPRGLFTEFASS